MVFNVILRARFKIQKGQKWLQKPLPALSKGAAMRRAFLAILCLVTVACFLLFYGPSAQRTLNEYWNNPQLVNFWAAWIPFAISILLAFIPDQQMKRKARIVWRVLIIFCGFFYSGLLWHQQTLTAASSTQEQRTILGEAVKQSNAHSDTEIGKVKTEVSAVRTDLRAATHELGAIVSQSEIDINKSISHVGKPEPAELASLVATLWFDGMTDNQFPVRSHTVSANSDGVFPVELAFRNIADNVAATNADIWISVCDACSFASEPPGFDRPGGTSETVRHRMIQLLNPQTTMEKATIMVRAKRLAPEFVVGFKYACQTCSKESTKDQRLKVINPVGINLGRSIYNQSLLNLPR